MSRFKTWCGSGISLVALLLAACGGGGGSSAPAAADTVSKGVITAKGSIFVNGIEFSNDGAVIKIDDQSATPADLKVGMVVTVRGSRDDATRKGNALQIEARDALEGTIDDNGVDAVNHTITVLGQTIRLEDNVTRLNDDDTKKVFADGGFQPGDRVEIHGFPDDQGGLRATRVAKKTGVSGQFEIKGFVVNLGASSFGLSLTSGGAATLTVNFTGALPAGLANGSIVEVRAAAAPVAGVLTAASISLEDRLGAAGEKVEVEGLINSGSSFDDFVINGQRVTSTGATIFKGGLRSDFALGIKVSAQGSLDANGVLVATSIKFESSIKMEALLAASSSSSVTLLGKDVAINGLTRIDNGPLAAGDRVEVRAFPDRDGNLIASRIIKLNSSSTRAFLQGPVTAFDAAAGTLTILGVPISTAGAEFRGSTDSNETAISKAAFFGQLTANVTVVKVRWNNFTLTSAAVTEAEIESGK